MNRAKLPSLAEEPSAELTTLVRALPLPSVIEAQLAVAGRGRAPETRPTRAAQTGGRAVVAVRVTEVVVLEVLEVLELLVVVVHALWLGRQRPADVARVRGERSVGGYCVASCDVNGALSSEPQYDTVDWRLYEGRVRLRVGVGVGVGSGSSSARRRGPRWGSRAAAPSRLRASSCGGGGGGGGRQRVQQGVTWSSGGQVSGSLGVGGADLVGGGQQGDALHRMQL
ncbi:hypothetical protein CRUP_025767 [Coryphaenoides rupestris]|nr:hypothetical protein CRUP_025767 [Coryphaenoides rupestris]